MDAEQRDRILLLAGVETRKYNPLQPRDPGGENGGQWIRVPGFAKDRWKRVARPPSTGRIEPDTPPIAGDPEPRTMADAVKHWHSDVSDMDDLLDLAASGGKATRLLDYGPDVKAGQMAFADGEEGVTTRYDTEDRADSDQLVSALARAIGISVPRVLRVDDNQTVSDAVDGPAWDQDLDTPAAQRLGLLDLLAGIDSRDPDSLRIGPDGVVPVQSAGGFRNVAITDTGKGDKRAQRLKRLADVLDAAGPDGISRATINARVPNLPAPLRDELLAELLDTGDYVQVVNSPRGPGRTLGRNARFISLRRARGELPAVTGRAAADPPTGAGFWTPYARDGQWVDNPLTDEDTRWLRQQLDEVRPQFTHLGRQHWWQFASDRLDILAGHASGDEDLFAPRPLADLSTSELMALLRTHGLPTTGSREELLRRLYAAGITA